MSERLKEFFPDGMSIGDWFYQTDIPTLESLGKSYVITNYGVVDDGKIYTKQLQNLIDFVSENGGGVIFVPAGTYYTGALFLNRAYIFTCRKALY